jgi:beta-lactamase class A
MHACVPVPSPFTAGRCGRKLLTSVLAAFAACAPPAAASASGCAPPLPARTWRANVRAAVDYAHARRGDIAFAVRSGRALYGYRPDHAEWSASVLKAMLLVAYLDRPSVAGRPLRADERSLLTPMIERSDNAAADAVDTIVGAAGLRALAARAGCRRATAPSRCACCRA